MDKRKLLVKKLSDKAVLPMYKHDGDCGMDLTAISVEYNEEHDYYAYHTGLSIASDGHSGIFLFPRSSNRDTDAYLCNSVGIADSVIYRGEIILCFKNRTSLEARKLMEVVKEITITGDTDVSLEYIEKRINPMDYAPYKVGDRVAQMVFADLSKVELDVVENLDSTSRGEGGFGSTNTK